MSDFKAILSYSNLDVPDAPTNVRLMVTGSDNITVTFDAPLKCNGVMVIKYKSKIILFLICNFWILSTSVEWSMDENFNQVSFDTVKNCLMREYVIRNLPAGKKCYIRVSAGNMKGFGAACTPNPPYCIPSSMFNIFVYIKD